MNIEGSTVINRPIDAVFAFVTTIANFPRWTAAQEVRETSQGPVGIGTTFEQVTQFLGQRFESTAEVTEYEPNSTFTFRSTPGPVPFESRFIFESVAGGTRVTTRGVGEPGNFIQLATPMLTPLAKKQMEEQMSSLKKLLEAETEGGQNR
jgi:uncharacterized protein YndB with AHSA1/START domain